MSLFITSLNSGSNGNCYYIGNSTEAILIDAGISCRETEKRMKRLGLSMSHVKAIFVSHEHSDHIKGIPVIAQRYKLPVYITASTLKGCCGIDPVYTRSFQGYVPVQVGNLSVTAFPKFHDAEDPHSFIISFNEITIGVFTDIGRSCEHVIKNFSKCDAAFLETNYDEEMLENGRYPFFLKNRIRGGRGHLSNAEALHLFRQHKPAFMSHILLSHLSKDNNCPDLVKKTFSMHADKTKVIVASRYEESPLFEIGAEQLIPVAQIRARQLTMF
jgi:phosphoribosyl 1,2-cyclic phosphodiesterase